jgi:hypothetical protein
MALLKRRGDLERVALATGLDETQHSVAAERPDGSFPS